MPRNTKNQNTAHAPFVDFFNSTNDDEIDYFEGELGGPSAIKLNSQEKFEKIKPKRRLQEW